MGVRMIIRNTKFQIESIAVAPLEEYLLYWKKIGLEKNLELIPILYEYFEIETVEKAKQLLSEIIIVYDILSKSDDKKAQEHAENRVKRILLCIEDAIQNWEQVEYISFG